MVEGVDTVTAVLRRLPPLFAYQSRRRIPRALRSGRECRSGAHRVLQVPKPIKTGWAAAQMPYGSRALPSKKRASRLALHWSSIEWPGKPSSGQSDKALAREVARQSVMVSDVFRMSPAQRHGPRDSDPVPLSRDRIG